MNRSPSEPLASKKKLYAERDIIDQMQHYVDHVEAMTAEGLHSKSDIAAELAHRDIEIERLQRDRHLTQRNIIGVLDAIGPAAIRVREGGGPEDILASLALTFSKLQKQATLEPRAGLTMTVEQCIQRLTNVLAQTDPILQPDITIARGGVEAILAALRASQPPREAPRLVSTVEMLREVEDTLIDLGWHKDRGVLKRVTDCLDEVGRSAPLPEPAALSDPCPKCSAFVRSRGGPSAVYHLDGPCPPYFTETKDVGRG